LREGRESARSGYPKGREERGRKGKAKREKESLRNGRVKTSQRDRIQKRERTVIDHRSVTSSPP
jgi:hypothetical protein